MGLHAPQLELRASSKHKTNERAYVKGIRVQYCSDNGIGLFGIDLKASSATHLTHMNTRYPEMLIRFQEFLPAWYGLTSKSSSIQIVDGKTLEIGDGMDKFALPYAVLEHITEISVVVKADCLDPTGTEKMFEPTLDLVLHCRCTLGPQRDPFAPGARII